MYVLTTINVLEFTYQSIVGIDQVPEFHTSNNHLKQAFAKNTNLNAFILL